MSQTCSRANEMVEIDEVAKRRIVAAYTCDDRPSTQAIARRFHRSQEKIKAVLAEAGVEVRVGRRC